MNERVVQLHFFRMFIALFCLLFVSNGLNGYFYAILRKYIVLQLSYIAIYLHM